MLADLLLPLPDLPIALPLGNPLAPSPRLLGCPLRGPLLPRSLLSPPPARLSPCPLGAPPPPPVLLRVRGPPSSPSVMFMACGAGGRPLLPLSLSPPPAGRVCVVNWAVYGCFGSLVVADRVTPPRAAAAAARLIGDACIALDAEGSRLRLSGDVMTGSSEDEVNPVTLAPEETERGADAVGLWEGGASGGGDAELEWFEEGEEAELGPGAAGNPPPPPPPPPLERLDDRDDRTGDREGRLPALFLSPAGAGGLADEDSPTSALAPISTTRVSSSAAGAATGGGEGSTPSLVGWPVLLSVLPRERRLKLGLGLAVVLI